ncbi:MAG: hypothetical protein CNE89_09140 [Sphingomonadaceae bacterium MED-G03]|nr:MAG: hypothetical protein CNE89_09140 [Sphingomonadaceae bacterium MED-G03]
MHLAVAPWNARTCVLATDNEMGQPWLHGWPVSRRSGDALTVNPRFFIAAFSRKNAWMRSDAPQAYALPHALPRALDVILA